MSDPHDEPADSGRSGPVDEHDFSLIDDMLALSPAERLAALEETLFSLEALRAAMGSAAPTE